MLGPWVNGRWLNLFTGGVIAVLVMLSIILTASVLFPDVIDARAMVGILGGGAILGLVIAGAYAMGRTKRVPTHVPTTTDIADKKTWRMPPLDQLAPPQMAASTTLWMTILRSYLVLAGGLVLVRIVMLALGRS